MDLVIARGYVPYGYSRNSSQVPRLRVGPERLLPGKYPNPEFVGDFKWIGIELDEVRREYADSYQGHPRSRKTHGENPLRFSGHIVAYEEQIQVDGLHFRSGNYRGILHVPDGVKLVDIQPPIAPVAGPVPEQLQLPHKNPLTLS